jgi:adenylate cyclase
VPEPLDPERTTRLVARRMVVSNMIAGLVTFLILTTLAPGTELGPGFTEDLLVAGIVFVIYIGLVVPVGTVLGLRLARPSVLWYLESRPPSNAERLRVLRLPATLAGLSFSLWVIGAVVFSVVSVVRGDTAIDTVRLVFGITLGGLMTSALVFLLIERPLRPVFAAALAGAPPERPSAMGIRPRLLLTWALGSAVPLLAIMTAPIGLDAAGRADLATPMIALSALAICTGALITLIAARSVAEPIERVSEVLQRMQAGDLRVELDVDDASEVGVLQAGFNRMVAGLRERLLLEDLFGRHVGVDVARDALTRGTVLGGEAREVSVLFVDVIGSTAIAQRLEPNEVVALLNEFFGTIVRVVESEHGWVNKFEGDGALCVFGAPTDLADHAGNALRAARQLRVALQVLTAAHADLDAAIGVSTGTVVAGNVGAERRYEYTVIGDPVNEAARLTDQAKANPLRVYAAAASVVGSGEEAGHWRAAGRLALRGRDAPTQVYVPLDGSGREPAVKARTRVPAASARSPRRPRRGG